MPHQWYFRPKRVGDDISDPITGEFFADGSLDNPATALVREALQNALDASQDIHRTGEPVRVRLALRRNSHAAPAAVAAEWFGSLRKHLDAPGNGLRAKPSSGEPCDYLVVEDFGTSGLTGDTESDAAEGARNNFVDFMRSDGRTRKGAGDRGSWGVGKNVFPRSSRINAFLVFTVRADDRRRLIMGKTILKIRSVDGLDYQPACYLGSSWQPDEVPRPFDDDATIERFRNDFGVNRLGEPGLSIVVPWLDDEIRFQDILEAVVGQFYYAILSGGLAVSLVNNSENTQLEAENIADVVRTRMPGFTPALELTAWSLQMSPSDRIEIGPPFTDKTQWSEDMISEDNRHAINQRLSGGERIALRVRLSITEIASDLKHSTFFDVYLESHSENRIIAPAFFREQLAISGVKRAVGAPNIRALVVVEDNALAKMLRLAEPPNHTDWDMKTANFRNRYRDGNQVITFVKTAVKQIINYVRAGDDAPDSTIAIDFFALPEPDETPKGRRDSRGGNNPLKPFGGIERAPRGYGVHAISGGFAVTTKSDAVNLPDRLTVAFAYDVSVGSPWRLFEPADFDLTRKGNNPVSIALNGDAAYRIVAPNRIEVHLSGPSFELRVTGFDSNRDLIVRAYDRKEMLHADKTAEFYQEEEALT